MIRLHRRSIAEACMTVVSASAFAVGYVAGLRVCRVHAVDFEEWSLELLSWGEGR